jgi:hypothetical protein
MKKFFLGLVLFVLFSYLFNFLPIIPVSYPTFGGGDTEVLCGLNYMMTCFNTAVPDNFPPILRNGYVFLLVNLIFPLLFTYITYKILKRRLIE